MAKPSSKQFKQNVIAATCQGHAPYAQIASEGTIGETNLYNRLKRDSIAAAGGNSNLAD